jgi:hypothetical protein
MTISDNLFNPLALIRPFTANFMALLDKVIVFQVIKRLSIFYGTLNFITLLKMCLDLILN